MLRRHETVTAKRKKHGCLSHCDRYWGLGRRSDGGSSYPLRISLGVGQLCFHAREQVGNRYERYKLALGRALSLGLEFLVAADVIKTVTTAPSFTNIGVLAAVIVTRTFLSWSLAVEMEGRWPWQPAAVASPEVTV